MDLSTPARKRSVTIHGHPTSLTLEDPFWKALQKIAAQRKVSVGALVAEIDGKRGGNNLSSAVRLFVLKNS